MITDWTSELSVHSNWTLIKMGCLVKSLNSNYFWDICNIGGTWEDRHGKGSQILSTWCFCLWRETNGFDSRPGWTQPCLHCLRCLPFLFCRLFEGLSTHYISKAHSFFFYFSFQTILSCLHETQCERFYRHKIKSYPGKQSLFQQSFLMETDFFTLVAYLLMTGVES